MTDAATPRLPQPEQLVALAVRRAYRAFDGHRLGASMTVRRPDVTAGDVLALARPLRGVDAVAIDRWLPHAVDAWGTVEDLKALLPRALELFATGKLSTTPEILFGKLRDVGVADWPAPERAALDDVVTAVWLATLANHPSRIGYPAWRLLAALAELGGSLAPYLDDWFLLLRVPGRPGQAAHQHLDDLVDRAARVHAESGDLEGLFWSPQPREAGRLQHWLAGPFLSESATL